MFKPRQPNKLGSSSLGSQNDKRTQVVHRDNEHQFALFPTEGNVEQATSIGGIWKSLAVTRHDDDAVAFKPFRLVNGADRTR
jgi:hypothetical protein